MGLMKLRYIDETTRNWHAGMLSFIGQRVTGIALVLYLVLHLFSLHKVLVSGQEFRNMMAAYDTPLFHVAEWLLLVAVLFHMFNGLRIIVADWFGLTKLQRSMFWVAAAFTAAVSLGSIPYFFLWR